jgi:hypothetical protein
MSKKVNMHGKKSHCSRTIKKGIGQHTPRPGKAKKA